MMKKIIFSDKFTESLVALLYSYNAAPLCLTNENMKKYIEDFIENGVYINRIFYKQYEKMSDLTMWGENITDICLPNKNIIDSKNASYLCAIYMLIYIVREELQEGNLYEVKKIQNINSAVIMINTYISSLIMGYDFEDNTTIDFNANYMPNPVLVKYLGIMLKTELFLQHFKEIFGQFTIIFNSRLVELNKKIDREIIMTGISFMQIQAILLLMANSKLYPVYIRKIAKDVLFVFKEILVDSRIEKIEIDPAICAGTIRQGTRKTTGLKIFFALENFDRYCLRLDFPHEGVEYLHLNIHEPYRETAIPLNYKQYTVIQKKYGNVSDIFFEFGKLYWFRYDFLKKLKECYLTENDDMNNKKIMTEMTKLFSERRHLRLFDDNITKENMLEFVTEFGKALIHMQIYEASYSYTENENIDSELIKIKLRDILTDAFSLYQKFYIEEKIYQKSYKTNYDKLKKMLLDSLFDNFSAEVSLVGDYYDYESIELEDIFLVLYDIIEQ